MNRLWKALLRSFIYAGKKAMNDFIYESNMVRSLFQKDKTVQEQWSDHVSKESCQKALKTVQMKNAEG